jgi:hypothetical protein
MGSEKPVALLPCPNEPVAWRYERGGKVLLGDGPECSEDMRSGWVCTPLYTRPPASEPIPEVSDLGDDLTAVYLLGKRDGREEAAALISAQAVMLEEARACKKCGFVPDSTD